jgi:hypothetical protein
MSRGKLETLRNWLRAFSLTLLRAPYPPTIAYPNLEEDTRTVESRCCLSGGRAGSPPPRMSRRLNVIVKSPPGEWPVPEGKQKFFEFRESDCPIIVLKPFHSNRPAWNVSAAIADLGSVPARVGRDRAVTGVASLSGFGGRVACGTKLCFLGREAGTPLRR